MSKRTCSILLAWVLLLQVDVAAELNRQDLQAAAEYSAHRRGLALLIVQGGKVVFSEGENGSHVGEAHKIYSGTKGFWVLAALAAEEEGILKLDERVADTISEWRESGSKARVTVRELLNFTSGLDAEFHLHGDVPDRNGIAIRVPIVAEPSVRFIYGPAALQVFHEILKRKLAARGQTPVGYLERKVLRPMGLGPQIYKLDKAGNPLLAAAFQLNAEQWARMGRLILMNGAPVISAGSLARCFRGTPANPAFGMGFWNNRAAGNSGARELDIEDMLEKNGAAKIGIALVSADLLRRISSLPSAQGTSGSL